MPHHTACVAFTVDFILRLCKLEYVTHILYQVSATVYEDEQQLSVLCFKLQYVRLKKKTLQRSLLPENSLPCSLTVRNWSTCYAVTIQSHRLHPIYLIFVSILLSHLRLVFQVVWLATPRKLPITSGQLTLT